MNGAAQELLRVEFSNLRHQREEMIAVLGMIQRFSQLVPAKTSLQEICNHLVRILIELTDFERSSISLWDDKGGFLRLVSSFGFEGLLEDSGDPVYRWSESHAFNDKVTRRVFDTRDALFVEDMRRDPVPVKADAVILPVSLVCLPLLDVGVLLLSAGQPRQFSSQTRRNWMLVSDIIGHLILGTSLNDRLNAANHSLAVEVDRKTRALEEKTRAMEAANTFLEQVLDHTPQGICILDNEGKIDRINAVMERLLGKPVGEIRRRSPGIFFEDPERCKELLEKARKGQRIRLNDVVLVNAAGCRYPTDIFLSPIEGDDSDRCGYLLMVEDITEKKTFADQLMRTEKLAALGTMAGGVAHDFNNILMTILGNTQLLVQHLGSGDPEIGRRLQHIEQAVNDGAHIVRRLQKFTEKDRDPNAEENLCDVSDAIKDVVELTRPRWKNTAEKNGAKIEVRLKTQPLCRAAVHRSDLREILTNLVFNAIDAMPEGGELVLSSRTEGDWVVIEVADSGVGMDEEVQKRIFDPFYTTKGVGNSGLGLSVCWSLVKRYGGDLVVRSRPGRGTTFVIRLPGAGEAETACGIQSGSSRKIGGYRLLVVDDEKEILDLLGDMLRLMGHKVTAAHDPGEALSILERDHFDLVLTDLGMPVISGWDIARKSKERLPETPVVLVTGWGAQYEDEDLTGRGIDLVVSKPLSYQKLMGALEKFL
jgi:PAS domain S-box-containing protein